MNKRQGFVPLDQIPVRVCVKMHHSLETILKNFAGANNMTLSEAVVELVTCGICWEGTLPPQKDGKESRVFNWDGVFPESPKYRLYPPIT